MTETDPLQTDTAAAPRATAHIQQEAPPTPPKAPRLRADGPAFHPYFSQPVRQIVLMLVVLGLVGAGVWLAFSRIAPIFEANPWLNGAIIAVFILGVLGCFWQVVQLTRSVRWIEGFARDPATASVGPAPPILAPLAALLGSRNRRMAISSTAARSILESVASRIDEARDITRYLANLLIFLGLLGTFYGLATTVPAVVDTIRALAPENGDTGVAIFDKLMSGLEAQLGGMGTAFSSSLLGLAGSLIVGLLELFASHGQNRFYGELEEWMSSFTRLGIAGDGSEAVDQATIVGVLDQMATQMEALEDFYAHAEVGRSTLEARLDGMSHALDRLGNRIEAGLGEGLARVAESGAETPARLAALAEGGHAQFAILTRIAEAQEALSRLAATGQDQAQSRANLLSKLVEGQERLIEAAPAAAAAAPQPEAGDAQDEYEAEARMRLRSIDLQLLRLSEDLAEGRFDALAELRGDIRELTAALDALTAAAVETPSGGGGGA